MTASTVERFRAFNRFYTATIGVLERGYLHSPFGLPEARVLFELGRGGELEGSQLRDRAALDPGHLSRVLAGLESRGLVRRRRSDEDGRRQLVALTTKGRNAYAKLNGASAAANARLLERLTRGEREELLSALDTVEQLLGGDRSAGELALRDLEPGDLGWAIERNGAVYADEYGWDQRFEALCAEILSGFGRERDGRRERGWIAELDGRRAGCVFCVRVDDETAKLRILLVEPWARGRGVGGRLVDECVAFARSAGYYRVVLWTNDVLADARRIYERAGFRLVEEAPHRAFGRDLVEQTWSLEL